MTGSPAALTRRYADTAAGQIHVVTAGAGDPPVVLLHQTPRSWNEFAEVIPVLARDRRVVAVDLPGMGGSAAATGGDSIEGMADGVVGALDALGVDPFDLVGHHTGGVVAVEVAARLGPRVRRLVLSSTALVDADARAARVSRPAIDAVEVQADGSHLTELWQRRAGFYPADRPDLLQRFVADALRARDPEAGHRAVGRYAMEDRLPLVTARTLLVGHDGDPYAFGELEPLAAALPASTRVTTTVIDGGMVPLELTAAAFADAVTAFLTSP